MNRLKFRAFGWEKPFTLEELVDNADLQKYIKEQAPQVKQFTGLLDRENNEIYEGDIVSMHGDSQRSAVEWDYSLATPTIRHQAVSDEPALFEPIAYHTLIVRVIGNVYDNPNLL